MRATGVPYKPVSREPKASACALSPHGSRLTDSLAWILRFHFLFLQQPARLEPVAGTVGPTRARVRNLLHAITVTARRVEVQFRRNLVLRQRHVKRDAPFARYGVVGRVREEHRWRILLHLELFLQ